MRRLPLAAGVVLAGLPGLAIWGCADSGPSFAPMDAGVSPVDDPVAPGAFDRDRDGLCDDTEAAVGTDPERLDTDADGLPDLIEVALDYDSGDARDPLQTDIVRLPAVPGATAALEVRVRVTGAGEGVEGVLRPLTTLYDLPIETRLLLDGVVTTAATPQDNVRDVSVTDARIGAVTGLTQLVFRARFRFRLDADALPPCVMSFPVAFVLKSDEAQELARRDLLLLVGPGDDLRAAEAHCFPDACL